MSEIALVLYFVIRGVGGVRLSTAVAFDERGRTSTGRLKLSTTLVFSVDFGVNFSCVFSVPRATLERCERNHGCLEYYDHAKESLSIISVVAVDLSRNNDPAREMST